MEYFLSLNFEYALKDGEIGTLMGEVYFRTFISWFLWWICLCLAKRSWTRGLTPCLTLDDNLLNKSQNICGLSAQRPVGQGNFTGKKPASCQPVILSIRGKEEAFNYSIWWLSRWVNFSDWMNVSLDGWFYWPPPPTEILTVLGYWTLS